MFDSDHSIGVIAHTEFNGYQETLDIPTYYDPTIFQKFYLVQDSERFAGGATLFCKKCQKPVYMKEMYFDCQKHFVVVKVKCMSGCGANWKFQLPITPSKDIEHLT
jgi:hypothetical protein